MSCAFDTTKCAKALEIPKTAGCNDSKMNFALLKHYTLANTQLAVRVKSTHSSLSRHCCISLIVGYVNEMITPYTKEIVDLPYHHCSIHAVQL